MQESTEAFCKRILDDIPEFEQRITTALNVKKGKGFHLKRAGTILFYMKANIDSALSLIFNSKIIERDKKGKITKGGKKKNEKK